MLNVVIAQGDGFYGSAFVTTPHDLFTIALVLENMGVVPHVSKDSVSATFPPDTSVTARPWDGCLQPKPVVLFDSGHELIDLHVLNAVNFALNMPGVSNGALFARCVEKKGWRERVVRLGGEPALVLGRAKLSVFPPLSVAD